MENEKIEDYLKKLQEIEQNLSNDDDENIDMNFLSEIEGILSKITTDISKDGELNNNLVNNTDSPKPYIFSNDIMIKVKKLNKDAIIPSYSKIGDAGMDLTITSEIENTSFSVSYGFGIAMEIPQGYVGLIFPRSSVRNQDLILSNCVGVIDSGYRGELQATFKKTNGLDSIKYKVGERGAQIIILPYPTIYMTEVPELSNTERGSGGFGSTGV